MKVRRKRVFTDFLQRVERAVCPEQGKKGIKWVFWGSAVFRTSRKGCVPVMGPRKMMRMLQARYMEWSVQRQEWTSRVVPVWEYRTSKCCAMCGAEQRAGSARKPRRQKGRPARDASRREWRKWRLWEERPLGYERLLRPVRGLKTCSSTCCGLRAYRNRDANACRNIGRAGQAMVDGRLRDNQLLPKKQRRPPTTGPSPPGGAAAVVQGSDHMPS